jgi:hypothetical protein
MEKDTSFRARIERGGSEPNSGYFVLVPEEISKALGARGQLRVLATIEGKTFRLSLAKYGERHWLGLRAEVREAIDKSTGDEVRVELKPDLEPREVSIPDELKAALDADPEAKGLFGSLSYSHRKEHSDFVAAAKQAETRERRAAKTVQALKMPGGKRPEKA